MKKNFGMILALVGIVCVLLAIEFSPTSPPKKVTDLETQNGRLNENSPQSQDSVDIPILSPILPNPNTNGTVFLNWTSSSNATYYNVYRTNTTFATYNSSILVGTTSQTNLTDWIHTNGTYYYGVTGVNKSIGESDLSGNQDVNVIITPFLPSSINLEYSRVMGGTENDVIGGIAVDNDGNSYVIGYTESSGVFVKNAYDDVYSGNGDCFIAKYSPTGAIFWETYFGGSQSDSVGNIAVDSNGNCIIVGYTNSIDFPVLEANDTSYNGGESDIFLAKFNSTGALQWSTYYGGNGNDYGYDLALDDENNTYITGSTNSTDLPLLNPAFSVLNGVNDMCIAKFNETGDNLWTNYYGGSRGDTGYGIAVDQTGNCYITGSSFTDTVVFYPDPDPPYYYYYYDRDIKVAKFNSMGELGWNIQITGNHFDVGNDIAVDLNNNCYITGLTLSNNYPTKNAYDSTFDEHYYVYDGFVTALNPEGSIKWSTFLGGSNGDGGYAIAVDNQGNSYVTGETYSTDFPNVFGIDNYQGGGDLFLTRFNTDGLIISSSYIGGTGEDYGNVIAYDNNGNVNIGGGTESNDFPIINVDNSVYKGKLDGFIMCYPWVELPATPVLIPINPSCSFTGDITLTWNPVEGATDYIVYRSSTKITTLNSSVDQIGTWNTTTAFDQVPTIGNFYYAIRASNASGYSNLSNCQNITVNYIVVQPPTLHPIDSIVMLGNSVHLTWNTSYRYNSFKIYRSTTEITSLQGTQYIGSSTSTGFYDTPINAGRFYYVVTALFSTFESVISNNQSVIINEIPQIVAANLTFVKGIPQQFYEFTITDTMVNQTRVIVSLDGSTVANFTWTPNTAIKLPVEHLLIGLHNVTINVSDGLGGFNLTTMWIIVIPNVMPQLGIFGEELLLFFVEENFTLTWNATDPNTYHPTYILFCDQIQVHTGIWESGANITLNLLHTSMGRYNYTLQILDGYGGVNASQITVVISLAINDEDGDGMTNGYERRFGLNPFFDDSQDDPDADQLINYQESLYNTNPFSSDSDADGITDWKEIFKYRTDPNNNDTDGDRYTDLMEIQWLSNPLSKWSTPVSNLILWIVTGSIIAVTTPLGIRRYKKEIIQFKRTYPELIRDGYILNLPKKLVQQKLIFFLFHCEKRLKSQGYYKQPGTHNWFSKPLWEEFEQAQTQITNKEFIPVAVQMTKMKLEFLKAFEIPTKLLNAIKQTSDEEIAQLKFSTLNADLQKIIKGFDQTYKKIAPQQPTQIPSPTPESTLSQLFLEWRDILIPLQQRVAYHVQIKEKIDDVLVHYKAGEWVQSASVLNQLYDEIESAKPPYSSSVKTFIALVMKKSTDFLATVHTDQIATLHTLQQQGRFDLALYSWLKYTQFKHTHSEDPLWQSEFTKILDLLKKQLSSDQSSADLEKSEKFIVWLIHAFASQTAAVSKIGELLKK